MSIEDRDDLIELLAAIEHERWAHWQRYVHSKGQVQHDGSLLVPGEIIERWERQIETTFDALPENEKESDREQVLRYLPIIENWIVSKGGQRK